MKKDHVLIGVVFIFVIASIVYGFSVIGFPRDSRGLKFDTIRKNSLRDIKSKIDQYATSNRKLPQTLEEATADVTYIKTKDPETNNIYEYYITAASSYKLCATFSTSNEDLQNNGSTLMYGSYSSEFRHKKGYNCFPFTAQINQPAYNYNYSYPTPTSAIAFEDKNILSVTTTNTYDQTAKFPNGFFSNDINERGFVSYNTKSIPVYVTVRFFKPVKLASVTNIFSTCNVASCYKITITGETDYRAVISIIDQKEIFNTTSENTIDIVSDEKFVALRFVVDSTTEPKKVEWNKVKFTYK